MLHCRACLELVQSVINAAARLTTGARKYDHVTPLLKDLHWLRVTERITYLLVVRSCIQLSSRYGATLLTRRHPVCRCNLTPSSPVDILVRPGGSDNAINPTPSFRRRGTSCMEQSSSIRHRLHIFRNFQKIFQDLPIFIFTMLRNSSLVKKAPPPCSSRLRRSIVSFTLHYIFTVRRR